MIGNITEKEQDFMVFLLKEFSEHLGRKGCNDLPSHWKSKFTEKEWSDLAAEYSRWNSNDPKDQVDHLNDFMIVSLMAQLLKSAYEVKE